MNSEPWARLMTRMMPNTSVTPTAIRNSIIPNCTPLKSCSTRSASVSTCNILPCARRVLRRGAAFTTCRDAVGARRFVVAKIRLASTMREASGYEKGQDMDTSAVHRVGIVGLGKMGHPMARHLARAKFEVTGYDIDAHARSRAQQSGITVAANPRAVAERSDFVIIAVGFDSEAEAVLLGRDGIAGAGRRGLIVGIASTVAPSTMARLAARLADTGIVLLDMPLTRGEPAAEAGELLVMVGGDAEAFESSKPALASFASSIFYLGQLGAGQVGKMVNNLILWSCISANHEGLKLAERLGVDAERMRAALLKSSAANWALETRPETMPMPWAEKDMRIVLSEADHLRLALPLCGVVTEVVKSVKIERGWPTPAQRET